MRRVFPGTQPETSETLLSERAQVLSGLKSSVREVPLVSGVGREGCPDVVSGAGREGYPDVVSTGEVPPTVLGPCVDDTHLFWYLERTYRKG